MSQPSTLPWSIDGDTDHVVWAAPRGLSLPVAVATDDDETVEPSAHPVPGATTLRLIPSRDGLTDGVVEDLLELLAGIDAIRPPEVTLSRHNTLAVPYLAPTVTDSELSWAITDQLTLVHADRHDIYFTFTAPIPADAATGPWVELTAPQVWLLVRALATIQRWQLALGYAYSAAATGLRTALNPAA